MADGRARPLQAGHPASPEDCADALMGGGAAPPTRRLTLTRTTAHGAGRPTAVFSCPSGLTGWRLQGTPCANISLSPGREGRDKGQPFSLLSSQRLLEMI